MYVGSVCVVMVFIFFFQAEDGIRDLVRSRGLGDVYKRQGLTGSGRWDVLATAPLVCGALQDRPVGAAPAVGLLSLIHI